MTSIQLFAVLALIVVGALATGAVSDDPILERGAKEERASNQQQIIINPVDDHTAGCNYSTIGQIVSDELGGVYAEMSSIEKQLDQIIDLLKNKPGNAIQINIGLDSDKLIFGVSQDNVSALSVTSATEMLARYPTTALHLGKLACQCMLDSCGQRQQIYTSCVV